MKNTITTGAHRVRYARCCRVWPIVLYLPVGRCGICGERPTGLYATEEEATEGMR